MNNLQKDRLELLEIQERIKSLVLGRALDCYKLQIIKHKFLERIIQEGELLPLPKDFLKNKNPKEKE